MEKWFTVSMAAMFVATVFASPADAGSSRRLDRWHGPSGSGIAIRIGSVSSPVAVFGNPLHVGRHPVRNGNVHRCECLKRNQRRKLRHARAYRWADRKRRIGPKHERVWDPGHYDRRGHWRPGRWITVPAVKVRHGENRMWVIGKQGRR